jgi:DNA recombination-dependent growth factor C
MKKVIKNVSSLPETLTEEETKPTGKSITIYLNAETLRYLDELDKIYHEGRSKLIQKMILQWRDSISFVLPKVTEGLDPEMRKQITDTLRKISGV